MKELKNALISQAIVLIVWGSSAVIGIILFDLNLAHLVILHIGGYFLLLVPVNERVNHAMREINK